MLDGEECLELARILRSVCGSGGELSKELSLLVDLYGKYGISSTLAALRDAVGKGLSLSDALERQNSVPRDLVNIVAVSERSGELQAGLSRYVEYQVAVLRLRRLVGRALVYPLVVFFILSIVLPLFAHNLTGHVFQTLRASSLSSSPMLDAVFSFWSAVSWAAPVFFLLALLILVTLISYGLGSARLFHLVFEPVLLRIPPYSRLVRCHAAAVLGWQLYLPLSAGIDLQQALKQVSEAEPLRRLKEALLEMSKRAEKGRAFTGVLQEAEDLPLAARCLLSLAEDDSRLLPTLDAIGKEFSKEAEDMAARIPRTLDLILLLMVGLLVGGTLVAVWYPLMLLPLTG